MSDNQTPNLPAVVEPAEKTPLSLRAYQAIWSQRKAAVRAVHQAGSWMNWVYMRFPLPQRVREVTTELFYHSVEHFIIQTDGYQDWMARSGGLSRLHGLLKKPQASVKPDAAVTPSDEEWAALFKGIPPKREGAKVAVIMPVYQGYSETLRCLYQVLSSRNDTPFELCVINDASPDEALSMKLKELAAHEWFELVEQPKNQGFVATVNAGMKRYESEDVILLNSDTEVYDGWLDRMMAALYSRDDVASVTPLSNHAELCSYPKPFYHNPERLEMDYAALDAFAATHITDYPELPTAVGFCMAIRRAAIKEIGLFDEAMFGRGYGEENDWCLRAAEKDWRHLLAPNIFVRHHGAVSFAGQKKRELKRSLRKLNRRHPHYRKLVRDFRESDPLLEVRRQIDLARLKAVCNAPAILMISHNAGGGTERHIQEMTHWLKEEGVEVLRLSPDEHRAGAVRLWHGEAPLLPNLSYHLESEIDALEAVLKGFDIRHMHLHHLIGFAPSILAWISRTVDALSCDYDVTIHDYYFACPSVNLLVEGDYVKTNPTPKQSQQWAKRHPSPAGRMPIWQWREQHRMLLKAARQVFVPSKDVKDRMQAFFPDLETSFKPHPETAVDIQPVAPKHLPGESLSVAVIGRLVTHKGYEVLLKLAQDARERELPILFHLFGEPEKASPLRKTGQVMVHGEYQEGQITELLRMHRCHVALFPAVWPETYSYTLSIALAHRLYPVCFDLGAPAERLREMGWGRVLDRDWITKPSAVNDALLALKTTDAPADFKLAIKTERYPSLVQDYYALPALADQAPRQTKQQG